MRSLRWVGLVRSLLIVGVLGGLMAPLPSEAAILKIAADPIPDGQSGADPYLDTFNTTTSSVLVLTVGALTNSGCASGFNLCGTIPVPAAGLTVTGSSGRVFKVLPYPAGSTPKLQVNDSTGEDKIKLSGLQFVPQGIANPIPPTNIGWGGARDSTANVSEAHFLRAVVTHTFNAANGGNAPGAYLFVLRSGGTIQGGPDTSFNLIGSTAAQNTSDYVKYEGQGRFCIQGASGCVLINLLNPSGSATNTSPLNYDLTNNLVKSVVYTKNQTNPTYPTYPRTGGTIAGVNNGVCNTGNSVCQPFVKIRYTYKMNGPDTLILSASNDGDGGGPCTLITPKPGGPGSGDGHQVNCNTQGKGGKKQNLVDVVEDNYIALDTIDVDIGVNEFEAAIGVHCEVDCGCNDPDICMGTIEVAVRATPPEKSGNLPFTFTLDGRGFPPPNSPPDNPFTIYTLAGGTVKKTFDNLPAIGGGPWTITLVGWPQVPVEYDSDNITCTSKLNDYTTIPPTIVSTWEVQSGNLKFWVEVTQLGVGDIVTCEWHLHQS